ncbi:hypothetical protein Q8A73_017379 [Channa argus]|nr:hypothetical protein Q8A73_017379 [Channa argus]
MAKEEGVLEAGTNKMWSTVAALAGGAGDWDRALMSTAKLRRSLAGICTEPQTASRTNENKLTAPAAEEIRSWWESAWHSVIPSKAPCPAFMTPLGHHTETAQPLVLNPSVPGNCSTILCKNKLTLSIARRPNMARVTWLFFLPVSCPTANWMQGLCQSAATPCRDLLTMRQGSY